MMDKEIESLKLRVSALETLIEVLLGAGIASNTPMETALGLLSDPSNFEKAAQGEKSDLNLDHLKAFQAELRMRIDGARIQAQFFVED